MEWGQYIELQSAQLFQQLVKTTTVEPLYNGHFGTSHFWVIFAVI